MTLSKVQVIHSYYLNKKYASLERFISYFHQIDYIRQAKAQSVLFIGVGDALVPDLIRKDIRVVTLDIDPQLKPDVVGDIRALPFEDNSFDAVCAFEVMEHLPFAEAPRILAELNRVARNVVIVSVPHRRTGFEIVCRFPFIRSLLRKDFVRFALLVPVKFPGFAISGQHYWEIDGWSFPLKRFRQVLKVHFDIVQEKTPPLDPYRRFFYLAKKNTHN
jgi:hypothetical protein